MLLTFENGIRGGIYNAVHKHPKANNKYMKNYEKMLAYFIFHHS